MTKRIDTIDDLTPDARNANKGTVRGRAMIEASIRECGAGRSIVVDREGRVIGGNKTLEVVEELGLPVVVVPSDGKTLVVVQRTDLDLENDPRARRLAYLDNRTTDVDLEWDAETIAADLEAGVELGNLFDKGELDEIMAGIEPEPGEAPEAQIDKACELQQKWQTARGQLWEIGKHRLLCGDSTSAEDVQRLMGGEKAQLAVTSPPYGVGKSYETKGIGPWFDTVRSVIRNICQHASVVVWQLGDLYSTGSQFIEPTLAYSISMFGEQGYRPLWLRVWEKQGANFGVGPYHLVTNKPVQQYEHILAMGGEQGDQGAALEAQEYEWVAGFAGKGHRFVRRLTTADRRAWGYSGVWKINTVAANDEHPAMFPVELPARCIKMHSDKDGLVLDPFLGSGTTMVAAEQWGRRCAGIELDPRYVAVTLERMAAMGLEPRLCES